jgi:hypothetical protein
MAAGGLDQAILEALDQSIEVDMLTPRRDGSISSRPVWVVVADGEAYVRSYLGESGAWYRRARADGQAALDVNGQTVGVGVEPATDDDTNRKVSDAFEAKYGPCSPGPTRTMVNDEVSQTTLRLTAL